MRALIVDDNPMDQQILCAAMYYVGITPKVCGNGLEAWRTLMVDDTFSLIISDYLMPEMKGDELIRSVRTSPRHRHIPILMVSGCILFDDIVNVLELGSCRFSAKPLDIEEIAKHSMDLLSRQTTSENLPF